jgi:PAS fold.
MTKEGTDASFASELLGGVPEAFVQTALLAGGVGLWEWPIGKRPHALSPYLETLLGYPPGGFESTKSSFLARLMPLDRPRFELALADAIERGAECDAEFRVFDVHGAFRCFVAKGRVCAIRRARRSASSARCRRFRPRSSPKGGCADSRARCSH